MRTGKPVSIRHRAVFRFLLPLLLAASALSCTQGKPVIRSFQAQLVLVESAPGIFSERLSFFAFCEDSDGGYDFGSLRIVHDDTGLEWEILPSDAQVRLRGADRWTGSASLAGPGDGPLPEGAYSATWSDLAGNEAPIAFNLVRPRFPDRAPAVFTVQDDGWLLKRNANAPDFKRTFLFLADAKGKPLYSYRVADSANPEVSGTIQSLLALAKDAVTAQCYTENESGSAGVLLIPVDIR